MVEGLPVQLGPGAVGNVTFSKSSHLMLLLSVFQNSAKICLAVD